MIGPFWLSPLCLRGSCSVLLRDSLFASVMPSSTEFPITSKKLELHSFGRIKLTVLADIVHSTDTVLTLTPL